MRLTIVTAVVAGAFLASIHPVAALHQAQSQQWVPWQQSAQPVVHKHVHVRRHSATIARRQHHDGPDVKSTAIVWIQKTADAAAPPPLAMAAVRFIEDVVEVVRQTTPIAFVFVRSPVEEARDYVEQTSIPGYTMFLQGRRLSLSCLNPDFVTRLAAAIHEARAAGINAGVYSGCRPPVLGVGGMADKSQSMHAAGLAVDMGGIGGSGSSTANTWYRIAAAHGIIRPYATAWEWNHMQPTAIKVASQVPPMKKLISRYGPTDLEKLWTIQAKLIIPADKAKPPGATVASAHHHQRHARA